jgi:flavin reductase (DIM6/NTAB) family NADH-FMN oxidoreductase RutF
MEKTMSLAAAIDPMLIPAPEQPLVESADFKHSMRFLAGAVSVVTLGQGRDRTGFTATSVSSLSADHPSILVSLNRASSSWPILQRYRRFCVNVLADDQQAVADNFAGRGGVKGADRYEGASWETLASGSLGLVGALTVLDCELEEAIERHSHSILIGSVRGMTTRAEAQPLLYWHGGYRHLSNQTA